MNEHNQTEFKGWARVEVMGHQTHIGYVETQVFGTVVMFRVDQPAIDAVEEVLQRPGWIEDKYAQPGSVVKREAIKAITVLIGAGSIYRIIPCDEDAAMKAIISTQYRPLMLVSLAEGKQITAVDVSREQVDDEIEDL